MSEFPSLPLFTDAFLADTGHLSAQETGAYCLLLMMAWRTPTCTLPDDDARLAKWARVDARTWKRIKPTVMEFWTNADGEWSQKRLTKEREIVSKRVEAARQNGLQGGRPKPLKTKEPDNPLGSSGLPQPKAPNPKPSTEAAAADARARDAAVSELAWKLAGDLAVVAGYPIDPKDWPPGWCGAPIRIQAWLNEGWRADLIVAGAKSRAGRRHVGLIRSVQFFEGAIADEHARQALPVPKSEVTDVQVVGDSRQTSLRLLRPVSAGGGFAAFARDRAKSTG